jgi:predicted RNA-binding Zn-ribbon protein involved in translation (DUF1610 family)
VVTIAPDPKPDEVIEIGFDESTERPRPRPRAPARAPARSAVRSGRRLSSHPLRGRRLEGRRREGRALRPRRDGVAYVNCPACGEIVPVSSPGGHGEVRRVLPLTEAAGVPRGGTTRSRGSCPKCGADLLLCWWL